MSNGAVMCKSAMNSGSSDPTNGMSTTGKKTVSVGISTKVPRVDDHLPVPVQTLASASWEGMNIEAQTMTPIRFLEPVGGTLKMVNASKQASFHLMIMLSDSKTAAPIPYSSVWATITRASGSSGKSAYQKQILQWPMISRFMGPHYGNDVTLPGSGDYRLSLLVSPPEAARASEYKQVWMQPHRVSVVFNWNAKTRKAKIISSSGSSMHASTGKMSGMSGMNAMGAMAMDSGVHSVNGVSAPVTHALATSYWQGMKIQTLSSSPSVYYMPTQHGASAVTMRTVTPPAGTSMNLMVELKDRLTEALIPYAGVQATVKDSNGKVVYHGPLVSTISAFQGVYYGANLKLPSPGPYTLTLRITPPTQARHIEYQHVWLHPHQVTLHITWDGKSS